MSVVVGVEVVNFVCHLLASSWIDMIVSMCTGWQIWYWWYMQKINCSPIVLIINISSSSSLTRSGHQLVLTFFLIPKLSEMKFRRKVISYNDLKTVVIHLNRINTRSISNTMNCQSVAGQLNDLTNRHSLLMYYLWNRHSTKLCSWKNFFRPKKNGQTQHNIEV